MNLRVFWSDHLETMADRMLDEWAGRHPQDPFERICVAVGDMATRNWIKDRFLLHRAPGIRRVLANIDFKPLPELLNDWLAAAVHGREGAEGRDPAEHPFSKGVMAWRIDAILREKATDPAFATLAGYVAAGGKEAEDRRRFDLATRLAQMFDDYLVSRHAMLRKWEGGGIPSGGDERWQSLLYRELTRNAGSYAADYAKALMSDAALGKAFENGLPRYAAVHVFDVMDAPWPYLAMLKRISETIPVTFWTFNPSCGFWLDNPTKKQMLRDKGVRLRKALENGENPKEEPEEPDFSTADSRLLGALATGSRGMLSNELDFTEGDCVWLRDVGGGDFATLRSSATELHVCHSPRRELEAARDALHRFFAENKDAKFSDALVLCADWQKYSPLLEAIFSGQDAAGADGVTLPVATAGMRSSTPIPFSFGELLAFRTNRFEVSKVFALLGIPEIRDKFGIDTDGLSTLRDMIKKDNIHWGYDEEDVNRMLGTKGEETDERFHFTWRRGLDRLVLDALLGPREDADALYDAGKIGRLLPNGNVESERATLVGGLDRFVRRLMRLRRLLQSPHTAEEWRDGLLEAIDDFYEAKDASLGEVLGLRKAVHSVAAAAIKAREVDGRPPEETLPGEVFCKAAKEAVKDGVRKLFPVGDAVRIAPLSNGSAVPARFVWICGLNDGTFPRNVYRPTFDLIGRHPTMYDVTPRERDTMSLLKAAMGARGKLCLSYVGRDIRTNAEIPPAVPLVDLLEWFRASGIHFAEYHHPLQAYSPRYFTLVETKEPALRPGYSSANRDVAAVLTKRQGGDEAPPLMIAPFAYDAAGDTVIEVDELAAFYSRPNRFLARNRLSVNLSKPGYDRLEDEDSLTASLPKDLKRRLLLRGADAVNADEEAGRLIESGISMDNATLAEEVKAQADAGEAFRSRRLKYKRTQSDGFTCSDDKTASEALVAWEDDAEPVPYSVDLDVDGHRVILTGCRKEIRLNVLPEGQLAHAFVFSDQATIYASTTIDAWVRHVAGHAAGGDGLVTAMMCAKDGPVRTFRPLPQQEARDMLARMVAQAMKPLPLDFAAALNGGDELPPEFAEALGDYKGRIVSSYGR